MTSPAGGQFSYTDDSVVARVAVDVPETSRAALSQLTTETERLATTLQTASRAQGDFLGYLRDLPQIQRQVNTAQKEFEESLRKTAEYQERIARAHGKSVSSDPLSGPKSHAASDRYEDPFRDQTAGTGTDRQSWDTPERRARQEQTRQGFENTRRVLEELRSDNPRQYENLATQVGAPGTGTGTGDSALDTLLSRIVSRQPSAGPGYTSTVFDMAGARQDMGTSVLDMAQNAYHTWRGFQGVQAVGGAGGAGGGGFGAGRLAGMLGRGAMAGGGTAAGGIAGGAGAAGAGAAGAGAGAGGAAAAGGMGAAGAAGIAGAAIVAGAALWKGIQSGGQMYQDIKNEGNLYGGGFSQGLQQRMDVQMMAMSPFISTEQAREIVMGTLSLGYQPGKAYETMTQFMADNLKDMGIAVNDQMDLVRTNVQRGSQSIGELGTQLSGLMQVAKGGMTPFPNLVEGYRHVSSSLVSGGAMGQGAGGVATLATSMFSDNERLKEVFPGVVTSMADSPFSQMYMRNAAIDLDPSYGGLLPNALVPTLTDDMSLSEGEKMRVLAAPLEEVINTFGGPQAIKQAQANGTIHNLIEMISMHPAVASSGMDKGHLRAFLEEVGEAGSVDALIEAEEERIYEQFEEMEEPKKKKRSGPFAFIGNAYDDLTNTLGLVGNTAKGAFQTVDNMVGGSWDDPWGAAGENIERYGSEATHYRNSLIDSWGDELGGTDKIHVKRADGTVESLDMSDLDVVEEIRQGKARLSASKDGEFVTFREASTRGIGEGTKGSLDDEGDGGDGEGGTTKVEITMGPELQGLLNARIVSPNSQAAYGGYGGSTVNNPSVQGLPGGGN